MEGFLNQAVACAVFGGRTLQDLFDQSIGKLMVQPIGAQQKYVPPGDRLDPRLDFVKPLTDDIRQYI